MIAFTLTQPESNTLASANYAYGRTYADPTQANLLHQFGARADAAVAALPDGAEEVTYEATPEEVEVLTASLEQIASVVPILSILGLTNVKERVESITQKLLNAVKEAAREQPAQGPDEDRPAADSDGLASTGAAASSHQL